MGAYAYAFFFGDTETLLGEATATGRWDLDFDRAADIGGGCTLGLRLLPEGWRIVRDETTSD